MVEAVPLQAEAVSVTGVLATVKVVGAAGLTAKVGVAQAGITV